MQDEHPDAREPDLLRSKLALETALISWRELEIHHARGCVVMVSNDATLFGRAASDLLGSLKD